MNKIINYIKEYFIGVFSELKKITWPSREDVFRQTFVVIVTVAVVALFFALIDFVFSDLVKFLINWRQ